MKYNPLNLTTGDYVLRNGVEFEIVSMTPSGKFSVIKNGYGEHRVLTSELTRLERVIRKLTDIPIADRPSYSPKPHYPNQPSGIDPGKYGLGIPADAWKGNPPIGRNVLCPCGSMKKWKKCHGLKRERELAERLKELRYKG